MPVLRTILGAVAMVWCGAAFAAECDCRQHIGSCHATGTLDVVHQVINFRAATQECAQITYAINGEPSFVTIHGGAGAADYLVTSRNSTPQLTVDSWEVCAASNSASAARHLAGAALQACTAACKSANDAAADQCMSANQTDAAAYIACVTPVSEAASACTDRCYGPQ